MPNTIKLPTSDRQCMFEFGGSKHTTGLTMLVATPSGFPNAAIVLANRKPNGLHVCSKVWPGCLICVATHQYGVINIGVYKIEKIEKAKPLEEDDYCIATSSLVTGLVKATTEEAKMADWFKISETQYPGIRKLIRSTIDKLLMYRCDTPIYTEPFKLLRRYTRKDPDFSKLLMHTDLDIPEYVSHNTPQYAVIASSMKETQEYQS